MVLFCPGRPKIFELAGLTVQALDRLTMEEPWNAIVYHVGNHFPFHGEIYDTALRVPGVVILHEYGIHHLVRDKGRPENFMEEMRYAYGVLGEAVARRFVESGITAGVEDFPLFERLTDSNRGLIVHNESARERVLASRPKAQVRVVPHPLFQQFPDGKAINKDSARALFGLPPEALVFGSFGFATPAKRLGVVLSAFKRLRQKIPTAHFLLVGDLTSDPDLQELLNKERLDGVEATGAVPMDSFIAAMRAVDIAVNLRHPPGGETSGSALRLMGMSTPLIVSDSGSLAEIPDHCCVKITTDFNEEDELLAAMLTLADGEDLRRQMGENVRIHTEAHHAPRASAEALASAIRDLSAFEPQIPRRNQVLRRPAPEARLEDTFLGGIGAALHELGVGEDDTEIVNHVADLAKGLTSVMMFDQ